MVTRVKVTQIQSYYELYQLLFFTVIVHQLARLRCIPHNPARSGISSSFFPTDSVSVFGRVKYSLPVDNS